MVSIMQYTTLVIVWLGIEFLVFDWILYFQAK